jgi:hypothetical protein
VVATPSLAALDQAVGVVWAGAWGLGWGVTIFALLVHVLVAGVMVAVRAR